MTTNNDTRALPPPPTVGEIAISFNTFYESLNNLCTSGKRMYSNTKIFLKIQYEKVQQNDDMLHNLMLGVFALNTLYMGGMWSIVPFAAGALSNGLFSDKFIELAQKITDLWNETKVGKMVMCAAGLLFVANSTWQIGAVLLGIHVANLLKESSQNPTPFQAEIAKGPLPSPSTQLQAEATKDSLKENKDEEKGAPPPQQQKQGDCVLF